MCNLAKPQGEHAINWEEIIVEIPNCITKYLYKAHSIH